MLLALGSLLILCLFSVSVSEKTFTLYTKKQTWNDASRICKLNGQRLAVIDSEDVSLQLESKLTDEWNTESFGDFWFGLHDTTYGSNGKTSYQWSSCEPLSETAWANWDENEPDHITSEHCIRWKRSQNKWRTWTCSLKIAFVCEREYDSVDAQEYDAVDGSSKPLGQCDTTNTTKINIEQIVADMRVKTKSKAQTVVIHKASYVTLGMTGLLICISVIVFIVFQDCVSIVEFLRKKCNRKRKIRNKN